MLIISYNASAQVGASFANIVGADFLEVKISSFSSSSEININFDKEHLLKFSKIYIFYNALDNLYLHRDIYSLFLIIYKIKNLGIDDISLIMPYIPYSRGSSAFNFLLSNLYFLGVKKIFTLDIHLDINQLKKVPGCVEEVELINISTAGLFAHNLKNLNVDYVIAPDYGAMLRAKELSNLLECRLEILNKVRDTSGTVLIIDHNFKYSNLDGKNCVIFDDIIDTGKTILAATEFLQQKKVANIIICCSHFLCKDEISRKIQQIFSGLICIVPPFG